MSQKIIKILVADDHAILREGLISLLETEPGIKVVGEAEDGENAVRIACTTKPDVIIMDIMMPILDGIAATRRLRSEMPSVKILILTTSTVSDDLVHAIEAGADGIMTKSSDYSKLLFTIGAIASGEKPIAEEIRKIISTDPPAPALSPRQAEILQSITRGLTNAEIAKQFKISPETVKIHVNAIYAKLGAANRAEAVSIVLRKHLLKS